MSTGVAAPRQRARIEPLRPSRGRELQPIDACRLVASAAPRRTPARALTRGALVFRHAAAQPHHSPTHSAAGKGALRARVACTPTNKPPRRRAGVAVFDGGTRTVTATRRSKGGGRVRAAPDRPSRGAPRAPRWRWRPVAAAFIPRRASLQALSAAGSPLGSPSHHPRATQAWGEPPPDAAVGRLARRARAAPPPLCTCSHGRGVCLRVAPHAGPGAG